MTSLIIIFIKKKTSLNDYFLHFCKITPLHENACTQVLSEVSQNISACILLCKLSTIKLLIFMKFGINNLNIATKNP